MTGQLPFSFEQAEAAATPSEPRQIVTRAALRQHQEPHPQEPPAPDWTTFAVNPESIYADDEQEAAALAEVSAVELKGYLFSARVLRIALRAGRNPLYKGSRPFTEKQTKELREDAEEAERFADYLYSQCADAFGEQDARRLYEYARACVDNAVPDEVPEEATREPEQAALTF